MKYEIMPYKSLGIISIGAEGEVVRKMINSPCKEFFRNEFSKTPTDSFDEQGLLVSYDVDLRCEAIEAIKPAVIVFQGRDLLDISIAEALTWLKSLDAELAEDGDGITSYKMGFGLYAPNRDDSPEDPAESAIVFRKGYYEN